MFSKVGGGVMISPGNSPSTVMTGIHIYMGGIGLQQASILVFTSIGFGFYLNMKKQERDLAGDGNPTQILDGRHRSWRPLLYVLFASLVLITTRIIFRMVEFAGGIDPAKNPIPYHEVYFMVLDAFPMFIAIVLMNIVHPGRILQGEGSEFPKGPTRKEKKEAKRVKKEAKKAAKEEKKTLKQEKKMKAKLGAEYLEMV
jgi:hypothetical protein